MRSLLFIWIFSATSGCAGHLPHPTDADGVKAARLWPGTTRTDLEYGRQLYVDNCSGCHSLHPPAAVLPEQWPGKVGEMKARAKLKVHEIGPLTRYLVLMSIPGRTDSGKN